MDEGTSLRVAVLFWELQVYTFVPLSQLFLFLQPFLVVYGVVSVITAKLIHSRQIFIVMLSVLCVCVVFFFDHTTFILLTFCHIYFSSRILREFCVLASWYNQHFFLASASLVSGGGTPGLGVVANQAAVPFLLCDFTKEQFPTTEHFQTCFLKGGAGQTSRGWTLFISGQFIDRLETRYCRFCS